MVPPRGKPSRFANRLDVQRIDVDGPEPELEPAELHPHDMQALDEYEVMLQTIENTAEQMDAFAANGLPPQKTAEELEQAMTAIVEAENDKVRRVHAAAARRAALAAQWETVEPDPQFAMAPVTCDSV